MKRIRIWLSSFNLVQQLLTVGLLTVFASIVIYFTFLSNNIDKFVNNQMKSYLHRYQYQYFNSENKFVYSDTNVDSYVFSIKTNRYLSKIDEKYFDIINKIQIKGTYHIPEDGIIENGSFNYVYSLISLHDPDYVLVSIVTHEYIHEFALALTQGVINITIFLILGLFTFFLIWVVTLIRPLNAIRNYIDKIKFGERAELTLNRYDEIGEVGEALVSMNNELSRQKHIREEMVQNISHDLKTPIATIKSYSESIKDGIYPYGTLEKSVDVIIENSNRLEKKAYNLNTYNKLGYLVDSNESANMSKIIESVILSIEAIRIDIKIETNINNTSVFHGEEEPWRIVVENLLENALRYAKEKVVINLDNDLLEVFNDGEQMSKDRLDKLFKLYEKGTKGNFGLGLSIVKRVCETYGYIVTGENMNDGVIFRVYRNKTSNIKKKKNQ